MEFASSMKLTCLLLLSFIAATQAQTYKVCYYTNWSQYRPGAGRFVPEKIDASLCTHLIYAFAKVVNSELKAVEWNDESTEWSKGMYEKFNDLKKSNSEVKTLLAVGGWEAGTTEMTKMLATSQTRKIFIDSSIMLLQKYKFDGLDLDFEYPGSRGSPKGDKLKFSELIKEFREHINNQKLTLLLSAAVPAGKTNIDNAYDIPKLNEYLDFISLMSYDYRGSWDSHTGFNSPLYSTPNDDLNIDWSAKYWVSNGLDKKKLVIGLASYGRCFKLTNPSNNEIGAASSGSCAAGSFTREAGFLSYYEICKLLRDPKYIMKWSDVHKVPYVVNGDTWLGYDNERSFKIKFDYIKESGYGGWMLWSLPLDDFNGNICNANKPYPLIKALQSSNSAATPTNPCKPVTTPTTTIAVGKTTAKTETGSNGVTNCQGKVNGNYDHPTDCHKFVTCSNHFRYEMNCPADLFFNVENDACDYLPNLKGKRKTFCESM